MRPPNGQLRIAYVIQNVGGIDLEQDIGDGVPVKNTLRGLKDNGHQVSCIMLRGRSVVGIDDVSDLARSWTAPQGVGGTKPFRAFESGIRRMQREAALPYLALFDSYRFYEAARRFLPRYDVCHEHYGLLSMGAAIACRRLGMPYVLTFSGDPLLEQQVKGQPFIGIHRRVVEWETRFVLGLARAVICVSEPSKRNLMEAWGVDSSKIVVLPNGVDLERFGGQLDPRPVRDELGLGGGPVIIFVGGFQAWHGLEDLVDSFARVLPSFPHARLLLVGDGPCRSDVERKVAAQGLRSSIRLTGLVPQERLPALLAVADVAVLPYPRLPQELWFSPLKLYEYMAAGKAIVASRSGQISEVLEEGRTGVLVDPGDIEGFAHAMVRLLRDPALRDGLGRKARQQAVERHSWKLYVRRLEEVYRKSIEVGSPRLPT